LHSFAKLQKSPVVNPRNLSLLAFSLARLLRIIIDYIFDAVALPAKENQYFCTLKCFIVHRVNN